MIIVSLYVKKNLKCYLISFSPINIKVSVHQNGRSKWPVLPSYHFLFATADSPSLMPRPTCHIIITLSSSSLPPLLPPYGCGYSLPPLQLPSPPRHPLLLSPPPSPCHRCHHHHRHYLLLATFITIEAFSPPPPSPQHHYFLLAAATTMSPPWCHHCYFLLVLVLAATFLPPS